MLTPRYLIFGAGSVRALAFLGALQFINLKQLRGVGGSSAGAILALALALRIPPELLHQIPLPRFTPSSQPARQGGFMDAQPLRESLENLIKRAGFSPNLTFSQVPIPLRVLTMEWPSRRHKVFSSESNPKASVLEAVLASASPVPFLPPVKIQGSKFADAGGCPIELWGHRVGVVILCLTKKKISSSSSSHSQHTIINIDTQRIIPGILNIGQKQRNWLIQQGEKAILALLNTHDNSPGPSR